MCKRRRRDTAAAGTLYKLLLDGTANEQKCPARLIAEIPKTLLKQREFFSWEDERQKDGREVETACWECLADADGVTDSWNNGSDGVLMGRKRREDEQVERIILSCH